MKPTDSFKNTIQAHLEARAKSDELFAVTFKKSQYEPIHKARITFN